MDKALDALAPVVLFVYNRPEHTRLTIEALANNDLASQSELWIFSDGAKNTNTRTDVDAVRIYINKIKSLQYFRYINIVIAEKNKGLAQSVIEGVTEVIMLKGRVIVLEDDLVTAPDFLSFMNAGLKYYKNNSKVGSISGYSPISKLPANYHEDVYLLPRSSSLGWATWVDRWRQVDWDVKNYPAFKASFMQRWKFDRCGSDRSDRLRRQMLADIGSWSIRFGYWQFCADMNTVYPTKTRILNIGNDGSGIHNSDEASYNEDIATIATPYVLTAPAIDDRIIKQVKTIYSGSFRSRLARMLRNNGFQGLEALLRKLFK